MKEHVVVPDRLLKKTGELREHFAVSYAYVSALKPKPTKRKRPKAAKAAQPTKPKTS